MNNKKIYSYLICFIIFISIFIPIGLANENLDVKNIQSILDGVTFAAINNIDKENDYSNFYSNFMYFANKYIDDTGSNLKEFANTIFVDKIEDEIKPAEKFESNYYGVNIIFQKKVGDAIILYGNVYSADNVIEKLSADNADSLKWLDKRIGITVVKADNSKFGYKISEYNLNADLLFEEEVERYFSTNMKEYINSNLNFTCQYPSIFNEDNINENPDGISVFNKEKNISFFVKCFSNPNKINASSYYDDIISSGDIKNIELDKNTNKVSLIKLNEQGRLNMSVYLFSDGVIYQGEYTVPLDKLREFGILGMYLKNTFEILDNNVG